jgi:hypothetical protein
LIFRLHFFPIVCNLPVVKNQPAPQPLENEMIEAVSFGSIIIDGKGFTSDVIIYPDGRIVDSWWRERGHSLTKKDMASLIEMRPQVIIAGTGMSGLLTPESGLAGDLAEMGIEFLAAQNPDAVKLYNDRIGTKRLGACFHLTC